MTPRAVAVATGSVAAIAPIALALSDPPLGIQVIAAAAGALLLGAGAGLMRSGVPRRRHDDAAALTAAAGFFMACLGLVAIAGGVGLYH